MAYQRYGDKEQTETVDITKTKIFEGYYLGKKEVKTKTGDKATLHNFKEKTTKKNVQIWGKAQLNYKLNEIYQAYPGILMKIEYLGKQTYKDKKTGQVKQSHNFTVDIDEDQYWKDIAAPEPQKQDELPAFDSDESIPF